MVRRDMITSQRIIFFIYLFQLQICLSLSLWENKNILYITNSGIRFILFLEPLFLLCLLSHSALHYLNVFFSSQKKKKGSEIFNMFRFSPSACVQITSLRR